MTVLIYLIPISLLLGLLGLGAYLWALRSGQFDDMEGAANRILFDDEDDGNEQRALSYPPSGQGEQERAEQKKEGP